jgi:sterol desaturase/sphingolipid hydroxylase (fatty acid hydroxylase superfamily)
MASFLWASMRALSDSAADTLLPYETYLGVIDRDRLLLTTTFAVTHTVTYGLMLSFFLLIDMSGQFQRHKVHKAGLYPPRALLLEATLNTIANHGLLQLLSTYYLAAPIFAATGALPSFAAAEMPGLVQTLTHFALCIAMHDTAFYWTHRMMHTPFLYKTVHKRVRVCRRSNLRPFEPFAC